MSAAAVPAAAGNSGGRPAILGGKPVRSEPFPAWPKFDGREERALADTLRSGRWFRGSGGNVSRFEEAWAKATGARHCLGTSSGTAALVTALHALGVTPGSEVILPPYTFVACVNAILMLHAVPVFVDSDPETFQIDARKIEAAINEHTRVIMPVHLGGNCVDLDAILATGTKHKLPVLEDACQAHFAEWRGKKAGTLGAAGCFSFQASKNLNSGEGGAILTASEELFDKCYAFHNNGRGRRTESHDFRYLGNGVNFRLTEFQAALLVSQMTRLEEQSRTRERNAEYLTSLLREIPGMRPARRYEGCTRNAYHLYMFRYDAASFSGLPRASFLKALRAEGVPASPGYSPLNKEPFIEQSLRSPAYQALCGGRTTQWPERNQCPNNDRLCTEAVWLTQNTLLGDRGDMEQIAEAVRRIQRHAAEIAAL